MEPCNCGKKGGFLVEKAQCGLILAIRPDGCASLCSEARKAALYFGGQILRCAQNDNRNAEELT